MRRTLKAPPLKSLGLNIPAFQASFEEGCLICSKKLNIYYFSYFWTNFGPIQVELILKHIIRPQKSKAGLYQFQTDSVIIGPTIAL